MNNVTVKIIVEWEKAHFVFNLLNNYTIAFTEFKGFGRGGEVFSVTACMNLSTLEQLYGEKSWYKLELL
jgi:hypothetical protein